MSKTESISQKINKLDASIDWFYGEDFSLDKAEVKFSEAVTLAKDIESDLTNLKNKITILAEDFS